MRETWNKSVTLSYFQHRTLIGLLGMALPLLDVLAAILNASEPMPTLSHYYYTNMRDVLTGILFVTGFFLISYIGPRPLDFIITTLAGASALGVALFPCKEHENATERVGTFLFPGAESDPYHVAFAAAFFGLIALNAFLFMRRDRGRPAVPSWKRGLYLACGLLILLCLGLLVLFTKLPDRALVDRFKLRFVLESIALGAFSLSWFAKGDTIRRIIAGSRRRNP